jgi:hypothetical protein
MLYKGTEWRVGKNREKSGDNGVRYEREYINERNIV